MTLSIIPRLVAYVIYHIVKTSRQVAGAPVMVRQGDNHILAVQMHLQARTDAGDPAAVACHCARGSTMLIRPMMATDWSSVKRIYAEGIATGTATFQTVLPEYDEWHRGHLDQCRLVVDEQGQLLGWAALSAYSSRFVYRGVAEISIYVASHARGKGVGQALLAKLIDVSEAQGFWTLVSGIFSINTASRALHVKTGFREVGFREGIGELNGTWHDVVIMERRSKAVGVLSS